MIVIVGDPVGRRDDGEIDAIGSPVSIARSATNAGAVVQLVGKVREGRDGDAVVMSVAGAGIRHAALLRGGTPPPAPPDDDGDEVSGPLGPLVALEDAAPDAAKAASAEGSIDLDAEDLTLALRYLPDYRVVVVAQRLSPSALAAVVDAARWAEARLVVVAQEGVGSASLPDDATVFDAPEGDAEGAFATMVGRYAAELDRGTAPADAFAAASAEAGWSPAAAD